MSDRASRWLGSDLMADVAGFFVQCRHPDAEHNPPGDEMPWNRGGHRRKFLVTLGHNLDGDVQDGGAELVYWGSRRSLEAGLAAIRSGGSGDN